MTKDFNKICKDEKTKLFQRLNEKAKESDLPMKVLEIGGGTGANFEFITEPINWTTIEPNEHCNVINGGAENRPIRKIVPKGKKENAPIFQNSKKWNRKIVPKLKN